MLEIQSFRADGCVDEVIEKYSNMVYRLALSQMKTRHDAEDAFQDVFLRYISKPRVFESEEHRKYWLIRVTINRCRSLWAVWFRKTEPLDEQIPFETKEQSDLFDYLMLLPQKYRPAIHLFYCEDMSIKEISEATGVKESTVRTWLTRARSILRGKLKGGFDDE